MKKKKGPIIAAGGVFVDFRKGRHLILICHRPKYEDWCLPKGKLEKNETIEDCARREIQEETGWRAILDTFLGHTEYRSGARRKIVYWWLAWPEGARRDTAPDVDCVRWVSFDEARTMLRKKDRPVLDWVSKNLR